jgi:nitronate monooxygenase
MSLRELFGVDVPILQAPMAGVQDSRLAAAVCEAGGLGAIAAALLRGEDLRREIEQLRTRTSRPFNVNFFCHEPPAPDASRAARWRALLAPYYREYGIAPESAPADAGRSPFTSQAADLIEPFRPPVVSFHFGLPAPPLLERVRSWGARVLSSATTVAEARWLEARGVDAIVAQGLEAGGHRGHFLGPDVDGQLETLPLVTQIARAVRLPVIAAGGIATATEVAQALRAGAAGVQIGTTYLLCTEATTSDVHRAAITDSERRGTALTNVFTGRLARGIRNRLIDELGPVSDVVPGFPLAAAALAPLRAHAERQGRGDFSPLWCGTRAKGCRSVGAAQLTRELAAVP